MPIRLQIAFGVASLALLAGCPSKNTGGTDSGLPADSGNPGQDAGTADSGSPGTDGGMDAGGVDAGTLTITATRTVHHVTEQSIYDVPQDWSATKIAVWVADPAADGGYDVYPGNGTDAGTLSVPNVPGGVTSYYLQVGLTSYVQGTGPSLDLSIFRAGRPDVTFADAGTAIQLDLSGLSPWQSTDTLFFTSAGTGAIDLLVATDAGVPMTGVTAVSALVDWSARPLLDATAGDLATVYQLSTLDAGAGVPGLLVGASAGIDGGLTLTDRATTELDGGMNALAQTAATWTFAGTVFDPYGAAVASAAQPVAQRSGIAATVGMGMYGAIPPTAGLLVWTNRPPAAVDQALAGSYGNPFSGNWGLFGFAEENWAMSYTLTTADGGTSTDVETLQVITSDVAAMLTGIVAPQVDPVTNFTVDGTNIQTDQTLASTTPLVAWTAPNLQVPTYYVVQVDRLAARNGRPAAHAFTATILTTDTSVRLFPGLLLSGATYLVRVRAVVMPGALLSSPLLTSFPAASADAISGVLKTP